MGLFLPFFIIVVLAIIGMAIFSSSQRRKELAAWAASHRLSFNPDNDRDMEDRFPEFSCLQQGHSRRASNIMTGPWSDPGDSDRPLPAGATDLSICAFDYHYETGSGKNHHSYNFSAVVVLSPIPLKPLFIRPEGLFDKVAEFFGADDIDFESAEFSRAFFVQGPDKRWAYDVIHQRMMEFLLDAPRFHLQFSGARIIAWHSSTFTPDEFDSAIRLIRGVLERLPDYLVRQQTGQG